jgi:hypothetical protein
VADVHNVVSVPLKHGTKSQEFRDIVASRLLPRLTDFKPDLILVSAGFDGHRDDVQGNGGGMLLVEDDYAWITRQLVDVADSFSQVASFSLPCRCQLPLRMVTCASNHVYTHERVQSVRTRHAEVTVRIGLCPVGCLSRAGWCRFWKVATMCHRNPHGSLARVTRTVGARDLVPLPQVRFCLGC